MPIPPTRIFVGNKNQNRRKSALSTFQCAIRGMVGPGGPHPGQAGHRRLALQQPAGRATGRQSSGRQGKRHLHKGQTFEF